MTIKKCDICGKKLSLKEVDLTYDGRLCAEHAAEQTQHESNVHARMVQDASRGIWPKEPC